jgi:heptosyltransferase III
VQNQNMPRRVGILRIGSLGDHLIAVPLYRAIRKRHGGDSLVMISNLPAAGNQKLIGPASILPKTLFDEFHGYPVGSDLAATLRKFSLFRQAHLDLLYYLMPHRDKRQLLRDRIFFGVLGIPVQGLKDNREGAPRQELIYRDGVPLHEHELDRLARALPWLAPGDSTAAGSLSIDLSDDELDEAGERLGGRSACTVALSIGTKCDVNDWGLENWSQLVERLADVKRIELLVLLGSADEFAASESLGQHWPRRRINLCGRLSPRLSAAVLAGSQLFIGHDSGPMHMAAAVGVPIVAVFSSRNLPGAWFPLSDHKHIHYTIIECMGCGRLRCDDRNKICIRRIGVNEVFASCVAVLTQHGVPEPAPKPIASGAAVGRLPR